MSATVLVTGANGSTDSRFCRHPAQKGTVTRGMCWAPDGQPDFARPNLELVPDDPRDRASLRGALDRIEVVYNIAPLYRPTNVPERPDWEVNVRSVQNMVEEAAAAGVKRFIQCCSVGVHGMLQNLPADQQGAPHPRPPARNRAGGGTEGNGPPVSEGRLAVSSAGCRFARVA